MNATIRHRREPGRTVPAVVVMFCVTIVTCGLSPAPAQAEDVSAEAVINAIERGQRFLITQQNRDGSWSPRQQGTYKIGVSSLALLALLNAGMTVEDEPVRRGLDYLRSIREPEPKRTYEVALMISALAVAKDGVRDQGRLLALAQRLEQGQHTRGRDVGSWGYDADGGVLNWADRSNAQFAILGLYEAAHAGIPVSRKTWERARQHWVSQQSGDGGWAYSGANQQASTGSMTAAGISTLVITDSMLADGRDLKPDGTPDCCPKYEPDDAMERALRWMGKHFSARQNPNQGHWLYYYLYGIERAGRLSGMRFFGQHDWYRAGAAFLVEQQSRQGSWQGEGVMERDPVVGTSFALLFLSKGLAPVVISKLHYETPDPQDAAVLVADNWNKHRRDIRNLTELISGLPRWPKLLTWQSVEMNKLDKDRGVRDLLQSPIAYISGKDAPKFTDEQAALLRDYIDNGGFVFAVRNCQGAGFDRGIRELVRRMYPDGQAELKRLADDHPVFRAEYRLSADSVELHGVDLGCRTPIIYSPDDLSCLWEKWARHDPPQRTPEAKSMITRATQVGINIVAYATGREPPNRLEQTEQIIPDDQQDRIERGLLRLAKLRHTGHWDVAPRAVKNLLIALNETVGLAASTRQRDLPATDPNIFKYPIVYMHGQNQFQLNRQERDQLRKYLERGGVLFADAACGSRPFDQSFRELMSQLFPDHRFQRIPADHEMFTTQIGHDLSRVKRRAPDADDPKVALTTTVHEGEPFLEGIEIDGRYAVIYSKFDISCVLERQASVACVGYLPEDAVKIAVNVILYALLQDVRYMEAVQ